MAYSNFIRIKDTSSSGALWEGEDVYILASVPMKISGSNITTNKPKNFLDTDLTTADTTAGDTSASYANNFNRRKTNVSYGGYNNQTITLTAVYSDDKVGNISSINDTLRKIFNPSKLMELVLKPRTIYIRDEFLIDLLAAQQDTSPGVYTSAGIPVILQSYDITPSLEGQEILMNLTFIEDKELS